MKWRIFFYLVLVSVFDIRSEEVSKGALTEGLFILQNKKREIKDAIQGLKKELTLCHQEKSVQKLSRLESYHCKLKQLVYPTYIDELSRLADRTDADSELLMKSDAVDKKLFDAIIKRTFLFSEKLDLERHLIATIVALDNLKQREQKGLASQKSRVPDKERAERAETIKKLATLKKKLLDINRSLFTDDLYQEVFLERLSPL